MDNTPVRDEIWSVSRKIPMWSFASYVVRIEIPPDPFGTAVVVVLGEAGTCYRKVHRKWLVRRVETFGKNDSFRPGAVGRDCGDH